MNVEDKELKINQQLRQVSIDQEDKRQEIRELEDLEADYFSIHHQEQRYFQDLIGNNQGSRDIGHFMELDEEANRLHQYERQRLEDIAERLVDEEVQLRRLEEDLYDERQKLFASENDSEVSD
ncbi:DUF3958 family protein [Enterococcus sp. DIV0242_7C1]|uniref:Uncharacterized protein n=1 Tax=Candidatus Enterococcus dunnyi TaxID=1834192 RepID=A0A200JCT5_9ENTE|nr:MULTISPECIES: DUF3958 family protein [unclassified Enterococcus]MBO0469690.1 DUF3958 family protein [Enterococcus sp. DIV0242_7C1]MCA5011782.1 DUF3958 family protein [Enterococcus sp. S23]MCA5014776.1 DUF3958 family protein [Enterococcus sp. S22(2020)]OUZ35013.1 hypothetical protein A5889_000488 [Enterococcus sp. 9D6_DIV0238]